MQAPTDTKPSQAIHLLASINRLGLKAFNAKNRQELIFLILNDTITICKYKQAALWSIAKDGSIDLLGISGYPTVNQQTSYAKDWKEIIGAIQDLDKAQILRVVDLASNKEDLSDIAQTTQFLWLPIATYSSHTMGLSLERDLGFSWKEDELELLNFLMQNYNAAWKKFSKRHLFFIPLNRAALYTGAVLLASSLFFHIPLPISAPCEIVPRTPIVIAAPLEGIIHNIDVQPGELVKKGTVLFQYDKRAPLEEFQAAKNQVALLEAQLKKDSALGFNDNKFLQQVAITKEKLHKEMTQLDLMKYHASQLEVKAPIDGVVNLENAEQWRGAPVHIGEKIMIVSDPGQTKIKIWIPESDNVDIDQKKKLKIILNVMPEKTFMANLLYIDSYSIIDEKGTPSFLAEAEWDSQPTEIKDGLKGTAVLYGEDVSILYWIIRRPWSFIRTTLGL